MLRATPTRSVGGSLAHRPLHVLQQFVGGVQNGFGLFPQQLAGARQADAPRRAFEQGDAQAILHSADLPGDGALRQARPFRRPRERTGFRHELKEGQFVEVERRGRQKLIHKAHRNIVNNEFYATTQNEGGCPDRRRMAGQ